jgi:hypothetical protein
MDSRTTGWKTLICLTICLIGVTPLGAQIQAKPISIVIHSTIQLDGDGDKSFEMVVSSKEQKYIRASIRNPKKTAGADIIYNGKAIAIVERETLQSKSRVVVEMKLPPLYSTSSHSIQNIISERLMGLILTFRLSRLTVLSFKQRRNQIKKQIDVVPLRLCSIKSKMQLAPLFALPNTQNFLIKLIPISSQKNSLSPT